MLLRLLFGDYERFFFVLKIIIANHLRAEKRPTMKVHVNEQHEICVKLSISDFSTLQKQQQAKWIPEFQLRVARTTQIQFRIWSKCN